MCKREWYQQAMKRAIRLATTIEICTTALLTDSSLVFSTFIIIELGKKPTAEFPVELSVWLMEDRMDGWVDGWMAWPAL